MQVDTPALKSIEDVPFYEILSPYLAGFSQALEEHTLSFTVPAKKKMCYSVLSKLSSLSEVALQHELKNYIRKTTHEKQSIASFSEGLKADIASSLPFLHKTLELKVEGFKLQIENIVNRFCEDRAALAVILGESAHQLKIADIELGVGDDHHGQSTAIVTFSSAKKLIYKPRNIGVTVAYNQLVNWINTKLDSDLKCFRVVDRQHYGWLEYIPEAACENTDELKEYYYQAGILLATTYLLGSKDYHHENIIAHGRHPVIIDHETIIQPLISANPLTGLDDAPAYLKRPSVIQSHLIAVPGTKLPLGVAGFGCPENTYLMSWEKGFKHANTLSSKRVAKYVKHSMIKKNIPSLNGEYAFATGNAPSFVKGFQDAYQLFSSSQLGTSSSPIAAFEDKEVRFIWRPTHVYDKILKYLRRTEYMADREKFEVKVREVLSKAYQSTGMRAYDVILDLEIDQMLRGDIPLFTVNSSSQSLSGVKGSKAFFQYTCVDNILNRLALFSASDEKFQLDLIECYLQVKTPSMG